MRLGVGGRPTHRVVDGRAHAYLVAGLDLLLEQVAPQGWEFYAVTGALFIVLAFPGFTWRYLMKHHHHR